MLSLCCCIRFANKPDWVAPKPSKQLPRRNLLSQVVLNCPTTEKERFNTLPSLWPLPGNQHVKSAVRWLKTTPRGYYLDVLGMLSLPYYVDSFRIIELIIGIIRYNDEQTWHMHHFSFKNHSKVVVVPVYFFFPAHRFGLRFYHRMYDDAAGWCRFPPRVPRPAAAAWLP